MTHPMPPAVPMPVGPRGCAARKRDGLLCTQPAISGTVRCRMHAGVSTEQAKAKGAVVVELSRWGIHDKTLDPGVTLLQLMTQSFQRARLYGELLEQAYEAAERLQTASVTVDQVPGQESNASDLDRAQQDLDRIFNSGGVSALIGNMYAAAGKDGYVYATGEAIRGLVQLEAQERDRAAGMAAKAVAAGLATRQVELAERQAVQVVEVLRSSLTELARMMAAGEITTVDPSEPAVTRVLSSRLRALSAAEVVA